jgi:hypothetical protein
MARRREPLYSLTAIRGMRQEDLELRLTLMLDDVTRKALVDEYERRKKEANRGR